MTYSIVYSSRTGNTELLAHTLREALPREDCVYFGGPDPAALAAERLYVGFWTDKGSCDADTGAFLKTVAGKEVFLFGTAGFGGAPAYFEKILDAVCQNLDGRAAVIGSYMCQGKMPLSVRRRYEQMLENPGHAPNLEAMLENFDRALTHPDAADLAGLREAVGG